MARLSGEGGAGVSMHSHQTRMIMQKRMPNDA
jgi:hypothetical protein